MERVTGFYWCRTRAEGWVVAWWIAEDRRWLFPGWDAPMVDADFVEIGLEVVR